MYVDVRSDQDWADSAARIRMAEAAVSAALRVPEAALRSRSRERFPVARARQQAMYLAHVVFGLSLSRVGMAFGRDRTTVRHACAVLEDSRDDPAADLALSAMEAGLLAFAGTLQGSLRDGPKDDLA
jgi:chromosomal replication initiation ATPase DnaA